MARILLTESNFSPETPIILNKAGHEVFVPKNEIPNVHEFGRAELIQTIRDLKVDVLLCGLRFMIDKEILDLGIKVVATRTTGLDHIDTKYCEEKGIDVIPLVGSELTEIVAVPELVLQKMLELLRRDMREAKGKRIFIIGIVGRIGTIMDHYCDMLGMEVWGSDTKNNLETIENFNNELSRADIVHLTITASEENRNFFDRAKFEMMKDGSYFLNSSRGWLVEESALKWALESGKLAGAWSDFPVGFEHPNLLVTNHEGGKTLESSIATEVIIVHKLIGWLKNK